LTGNGHVPHIVAGVGVNVPADVSGERFVAKFGLEDPFVLYVGRLDKAKNVPQLIEYFDRFRATHPGPLKLALAGKAYIPLPELPDVVSLGYLSEEDKFDALQAAALLVMPSLYESLSMIALEAWRIGRPVLANGRCDVLKEQCRQSNGGLYYLSYSEFAATLSLLLASPWLRDRLGENGRRFVQRSYHWDVIVAKYRALLALLTGG
jgi:glycosyltransferase involved in cell wall biosynthesis